MTSQSGNAGAPKLQLLVTAMTHAVPTMPALASTEDDHASCTHGRVRGEPGLRVLDAGGDGRRPGPGRPRFRKPRPRRSVHPARTTAFLPGGWHGPGPAEVEADEVHGRALPPHPL